MNLKEVYRFHPLFSVAISAAGSGWDDGQCSKVDAVMTRGRRCDLNIQVFAHTLDSRGQ